MQVRTIPGISRVDHAEGEGDRLPVGHNQTVRQEINIRIRPDGNGFLRLVHGLRRNFLAQIAIDQSGWRCDFRQHHRLRIRIPDIQGIGHGIHTRPVTDQVERHHEPLAISHIQVIDPILGIIRTVRRAAAGYRGEIHIGKLPDGRPRPVYDQ